MGVVAATSCLLVAGCGSVSSRKGASPGTHATVSARQERAAEQSAERLAKAHGHYAAAIVDEMDGESKAAMEEYYQAAMLDPEDEGLVLEVSRRLLQSKEPEKALEVTQRAANRPDAPGDIYARLGLIYDQLGKPDQAAAANRTAIKRAPESFNGYQNLFLVYMRHKRAPEALKVLGEAARQPKVDAGFLIDVAELYAGYGVQVPAQKKAADAKAISLLNRAEQLGPMTPLGRLKLADGFNLLGESKRAAELYLQVLKDPPDLPLIQERVRANLADIYLRGSDHKGAIEQLQAILRDDPTNPQAYYYLGRLALEANKPAEAAENFSKTVMLSPDFESGYLFLAMAQLNLKQNSEALATLDKARRKFPAELCSGVLYRAGLQPAKGLRRGPAAFHHRRDHCQSH